ncbi:MAG: ATP-binding protein [Gemmatimonas sp.]
MPLLRLSPRALPVRIVLLMLVIVAVVPTVMFAGVLLHRYAASERTRAEIQIQQSAEGVARAVDAEFAAAEAALRVLASSPLLLQGDLAAAEQRLRNATAATGRYFALIRRDGQHVVNTFFPEGMPLPKADESVWAPVFGDPKTYITGVIHGAGHGELLTGVGVPVVIDGDVRWVLATRLNGGDFRTVMDQPGVPAEWVVSIVDSTGTILTRSRAAEQFAGRHLSPDILRYFLNGGRGVIPSMSLDGQPLIATVADAPNSHWAAAVGMPQAALEAPLQAALRDLGIIGAVIALIVVALVFLLARHIDHSLHGLSDAARAVNEGKPLVRPYSKIREINAVTEVLADALERQRAFTATLEAEVAARTSQLRAEMRLREESEAQVRQMQKIEAIGQLTGGIAHDFNNMLAIVLGSLRLMLRRIERGEADIRKYAEAAIQGAERAANLTARLLAFGRQQPLSPEVLDVNKLVAGMGEVLRRTIPETVHIETVLAGGLWRAKVDPHGLENAIVNLAINARDAMPSGGKLTIETANAHLDESYVAGYSDVAAGQYVMIAVTDTGTGMPPDVVARAFDPFFTTKQIGQGTGLGLSQVHGFIKQSGGHVKIYSEPGHGTIVKLYLPRFNEEPVTVGAASTPAMPHAAHGESILIVEDEADVRSFTADMARELGYRAVEAESGPSALALLAADPDIELMITDVVMPGMNGRQLAEEALRLNPRLKVLFTTGYTRNAIVHGGVLDPGVHLISKPYSIEALALKIDELLREKV